MRPRIQDLIRQLELIQLVVAGPTGAVKGALLAGEGVGAVQEQHVQVGIQVQGRAEALNQDDRASAG